MAKSKAARNSEKKVGGVGIEKGMDLTLSLLREEGDIWYKISVLLYDLCNIATDRAAEARTLRTTDELYISAPYFTPEEASLIKSTLVPTPTLSEIPEFIALSLEEVNSAPKEVIKQEMMTIEVAIKSCLENFFEKRRASGDARPCGPHDMGPIYQAVFGITKEDLKNEKFLGRLRRAGLPKLCESQAVKVKEPSVKGNEKKEAVNKIINSK